MQLVQLAHIMQTYTDEFAQYHGAVVTVDYRDAIAESLPFTEPLF